eukprot:5028026-Pleurochrysis_carterae.AAC.2
MKYVSPSTSRLMFNRKIVNGKHRSQERGFKRTLRSRTAACEAARDCRELGRPCRSHELAGAQDALVLKLELGGSHQNVVEPRTGLQVASFSRRLLRVPVR